MLTPTRVFGSLIDVYLQPQGGEQMAKITELVRRVYRYEQRSAVETAYPSNVLLLLAAIVLVINLCNNSAGNARHYVKKLGLLHIPQKERPK